MQQDPLNLIWIDLEMTGLDPETDSIIEIATVVTDKQLNILAQGPVLAVHKSKQVLNGMDAWNQKHHGQSGLIDRVIQSQVTERDAEMQTLAFLRKWVIEGKSPMCGNSICQDRRFLHRYMAELESYFHYRNLDVSSIKELVNRWAPELKSGFVKKAAHLALDDIIDSINELKYYRKHLFVVNAH